MARLIDIDLLLKRFQDELNWDRPPHSGPTYDYDKLRFEILESAERFLQEIAEETPDLTLVPVPTPTQERDAEQVDAMLASTRPLSEEQEAADPAEAEDALFDAAQRISRRDGLDWDRSRGLIYQRAEQELAEASLIDIEEHDAIGENRLSINLSDLLVRDRALSPRRHREHLQASRDEAVETVELQCEKLIMLAKALHKANEERDALAATVETQGEALRWFNLPLSECGYDYQFWFERAQKGQRAVLAAEGRFEDYTPVPYDEAFPGQRPEQLASRLSDALEALQVAEERVSAQPCECRGQGTHFCWRCSLSEFLYRSLGEMHRRPESLLDLARRFESERNEAEDETRESIRRLSDAETRIEFLLGQRNAKSRGRSWEYLEKERIELLEMLTRSERLVARARQLAEQIVEATESLAAAPAWLREDAVAFLDLLGEEAS